jgi:hypothetical protein
MSRAIPIAFVIVTTLLLLGVPFLGLKLGFPDDRVLPASASARQVGTEIRTDYRNDSTANLSIIAGPANGVTPNRSTFTHPICRKWTASRRYRHPRASTCTGTMCDQPISPPDPTM